MSETNGNGSHGNSGVKSGRGQFVKGFDPRRAVGVKGRGGRPRKEVRDMLVAEFAEQVPLLKADVKRGKLTRKEYADMCAKYGLGTTITETDTEGNDAPREQVVIYLPENGRTGR